MLYGEKLKEILSKTGVDVSTLPNSLYSTILQAISDNIDNNTGGGSDLDTLINGSLTELNSNATRVRSYAFYYCSTLTSVNLPNVTEVNTNSFAHCTKLVNINIPNTKKIFTNAFNACYKLESLYLPILTNIYADYVFSSCCSLKEILIEQTTSICTLSNTNSFNGCYHFLGTKDSTYNPNGLKDGYIYVPHTLLTQYKVATNWVQFKSQIIGHGDFASGDTLPNYADYNTYKTCKWYSDKELTQPVYEITMIASGEFVVDSGSETITTAGRYYCKLY